MTRIELGSPSISQKKHIIGYWVSDDPDLEITTKLTESHYETRFDTPHLINKWSGSGTYKGVSFTIDITEEYYNLTSQSTDTIIVITHSKYGDAKWSKKEISQWSRRRTSNMDCYVKSSDADLKFEIVRTR